MAAVRATTIYCDSCNYWQPEGVAETARDARRNLEAVTWPTGGRWILNTDSRDLNTYPIRRARRRDLCPHCAHGDPYPFKR